MNKSFLLTIPWLALICLPFGCAREHISRCTAPDDSYERHYLLGMDTLEEGNLERARRELERAVYCEDAYGPAYGGLAIVYGEKARRQLSADSKTMDINQAREFLNKAKSLAHSNEDLFAYHLARMRVTPLIKDKGWLEESVISQRDNALLNVDESKLPYYKGKEASDYFMGLAYLNGEEFQKGRDSFAAVLAKNRGGIWYSKAGKAWGKTDRIVKATAEFTLTEMVKMIIDKDEVTRGDLAALLVDEFKEERPFAGSNPLQAPGEKPRPEIIPADIMTHHFREQILTILGLKIRGLEPTFNDARKAYLFKATAPVKRGEFALALEDMLIILTGDNKLSTAYHNLHSSPFVDVTPQSPYFNAIMTVTSRSIMEEEQKGQFGIDTPIDGAETVLAIRRLKQALPRR